MNGFFFGRSMTKEMLHVSLLLSADSQWPSRTLLFNKYLCIFTRQASNLIFLHMIVYMYASKKSPRGQRPNSLFCTNNFYFLTYKWRMSYMHAQLWPEQPVTRQHLRIVRIEVSCSIGSLALFAIYWFKRYVVVLSS